MASEGKCPYCSGQGERIAARVVRQPSHLAFGYGERSCRCRKCGAGYAARYPVPPKGARGGMPKPNPGILKVGFLEGVRGLAHPVAFTAVAVVQRDQSVSSDPPEPREEGEE